MGGWESYAFILEWAQESGARVIGLDPSRKSPKHHSLCYRDHFAAKLIARAVRKHNPGQTFALMGEMHLAPAHLPDALRQHGLPAGDILTIYQHCDPLYFDLQRRNLEHETEVSRLGDAAFYLINTSPIVSQLSFLTWLEAEDLQGIDHSPEEKFPWPPASLSIHRSA